MKSGGYIQTVIDSQNRNTSRDSNIGSSMNGDINSSNNSEERKSMNRSGHKDVNFFWGKEVEHTPALGMSTLFVIGYHAQDAIDAALRDANFDLIPGTIKHIFFGANDSFHPFTADQHQAWESVISTYLDRGFWCSLDIPFGQVAQFNEGGLCEHDRFIPILKVPIPYIKLWNYNTCVKIDDRDFAATNPGVWVHQLHDLQARKQFTSWNHYDNDVVIT